VNADVEYSIIIPVYQSGPWLEGLLERIVGVMNGLGASYEVILVNDASPDGVTWPAILTAARRHPQVHGFDLLCRTGQFRATLCGFEQARGRFLITMDDDLQHPPEELPKLVAAMRDRDDIDCVFGRYDTSRRPLVRKLGTRVHGLMLRIVYGKPRDLAVTSFRILRRELAQTLVLYRSAHPQIGPLILTLTRRLANVTVAQHERPHGRSGYGWIQLAGEIQRSIVNGSVAPLRAVSCLGLLSAGLAFAIGAWYLARKLTGGIRVPGYASTVLIITFFSGVILIGIGIVGEYLIRIMRELTGMPRYMIRATTDRRSDDE